MSMAIYLLVLMVNWAIESVELPVSLLLFGMHITLISLAMFFFTLSCKPAVGCLHKIYTKIRLIVGIYIQQIVKTSRNKEETNRKRLDKTDTGISQVLLPMSSD